MEMTAAEEDTAIHKRFDLGSHDGIFQNPRLVKPSDTHSFHWGCMWQFLHLSREAQAALLDVSVTLFRSVILNFDE
jgi:hypothetical protein